MRGVRHREQSDGGEDAQVDCERDPMALHRVERARESPARGR